MDTHQFQEGVKVQRFCLTLVGEARLWYESLKPINVNWLGLQKQFKQQYSKIGNTREQLFHAWQSFHFHKNTETLDGYAMCIGQVATLLGYGEPQILKVFKNTLCKKLYWVLFSIDDLRQAVKQPKVILMKEKIDRKLAGQSSSTPFINLKDSYNNKKVTFDTWDGSEDRIDRLTVVMGKLTTKDNGINKQVKPEIYQNKKKENRMEFL